MGYKALKKYLTRTPPQDYFTEDSPLAIKISLWISVASIMYFLLLALFDPGYMNLSIIYIVIALMALVFTKSELEDPLKTPWGATGTSSENQTRAIMLGTLIGLGFAIPNILSFSFTGSLLLSEASALPQMGFYALFATYAIVIPLVEMNFFAKVLVPSMMQLGGTLAGVVIPVVFFVMSHYGAYGLAIPSLLFISAFRVVTATEVMSTKNYLVSLIPHIIVNATSVIVTYWYMVA